MKLTIRDAKDATPSDLVAFAGELAQAARAETLPRWEASCASEDKSGGRDFDPVTEADRNAELAMRRLIEARFPSHGISGEEFPDREANSRYRWSLDPVDGTRSFICRLPTWVTLIALLEDDLPVIGVIDAPCLDELYHGSEGGWIETKGTRSALKTSACSRIEEARLSTTDPYLFEDEGKEGWERLRNRVRTTRYGHDGYAYARLAGGSLDLVVESKLKPHDYNALIPVVRSAGGMIGDWNGGTNFSEGKVIAAATPALYEATVKAML